jgi:hypothetical protein
VHRVRLVFGILTVLACLATVSARAEFRETPLFEADGWSVEHTYSPADGLAWCAAATRNPRGQTFDVTAYASGGAALFVFDPSWALARRPVVLDVTVDGRTWRFDGTAREVGISAVLRGSDRPERFLDALSRGRSVTLADDRGNRLASFALAGAGPALDRLIGCWSGILPDPRIRRAALPAPVRRDAS